MLNSHIQNFATSIAYDENVIATWRRVTQKLFRAVDSIMTYRSFLIMADDGEVELPSVEPDDTTESYPTRGSYCKWEDIIKKSDKVTKRSINEIIPKVLNG